MNRITITKNEILGRYKPVISTTHKGMQGHALLIGGSYGKIGSICLSAKAALKSGCGLVTVFVPKCGYQIVQIALPEAMVLTDKAAKYISKIHFPFVPNAIGIGSGMGQEKETTKALYQFLKFYHSPLVIDADGLNILAQNEKWLAILAPQTILTPHPKELERLIGSWISDADKLQKAVNFSRLYKVILVLKDATTCIVDGALIYENTTGNQALATAGSGDVLTGIITSLMAQSYKPVDAAILGVYLHGLTADLALPDTGYQSFIASDIVAHLGKAYLSLEV